MSNTEKRYAQIEKEALAIVCAYERFHDFVVGLEVHKETDSWPDKNEEPVEYLYGHLGIT